ncbi:MAG: hypothetical protein ACLTQI_04990 [Slackia sp.]
MERNAPESVVHPYTLADAATFARMGYLDDYPCFICKRDDGILVAGFPKDSYAMFPLNYWPQQTMLHPVLHPVHLHRGRGNHVPGVFRIAPTRRKNIDPW